MMMMAALLSVLLAGAPVAKAPPAPYFYALVLGEGATADEAQVALDRFNFSESRSGNLSPAAGFPRIYDPGQLTGLPGGRYYAVLGFCRWSQHAEPALQALKGIVQEARLERVRGLRPNACPAAKRAPPQNEHFRTVGKVAVVSAKDGVVVEVRTTTPSGQASGQGCFAPALVLEVSIHGKPLETRRYSGVCRPPLSDDPGETLSPSLRGITRERNFGASLLMSWHHQSGTSSRDYRSTLRWSYLAFQERALPPLPDDLDPEGPVSPDDLPIHWDGEDPYDLP